MGKLKKGDLVVRISYNKDILFEIKQIIKSKNSEDIYILKGVTERIEADSKINDLEKVDKRLAEAEIKNKENRIYSYIEECLKVYIYKTKDDDANNSNKRKLSKFAYTGKILHLDGDKRYADKSEKYYKNLGLNAVVKNVAEYKQPQVIQNLLDKYNPDVLVITGHDGMIKKGIDYNNIYNYRNSKYFIKTVREARKWSLNIAIFAGACQSFYEAIMAEGANFASSPARIMIDFIDPLIVAEKIATTDNTKYITINEIKNDLRGGERGISGIGSMGKKKILDM